MATKPDLEMGSMVSAWSALAKTMILPDYLFLAAHQAPTLVGGEGCSIFIKIEDELVLAASTRMSLVHRVGHYAYSLQPALYEELAGLELSDVGYRRRLNGTGLTGWVVAFNMYLRLADISKHSERTSFVAEANARADELLEQGYLSDSRPCELPVPNWSDGLRGIEDSHDSHRPLLAVPIRSGGRALGALRIATRRGSGSFHDDDRAVLQEFADTLGGELTKRGLDTPDNAKKFRQILQVRSAEDPTDFIRLNASIVKYLSSKGSSGTACTIVLTDKEQYFSKEYSSWTYRIVASEGEFAEAEDQRIYAEFRRRIKELEAYKAGEGKTGTAIQLRIPFLLHFDDEEGTGWYEVKYPTAYPELSFVPFVRRAAAGKEIHETRYAGSEDLAFVPIPDPSDSARVLGVIRITSRLTGEITRTDLSLLAAYAELFASKLLDQWRYDRIKDIDPLFYDITRYQSEDEFIVKFANFFRDLVEADATSVFIERNRIERDFELRHCAYKPTHADRTFAKEFRKQEGCLTYAPGQGKTGAALELGRILSIKTPANEEWERLIEDIQFASEGAEQRWDALKAIPMNESGCELGDSSGPIMFVPLRHPDGSTWGLIRAVRGKGASPFTSSDIQLANLFASGLTSVRQGLLRSLSERAPDQGLQRIANEIYRSDTIDEVYELLLLALTHGQGAGINRAILFDCEPLGDNFRLMPRMAVGPADLAEGDEYAQKIEKGHASVELDPWFDKARRARVYTVSELMDRLSALTIMVPVAFLDSVIHGRTLQLEMLPGDLENAFKRIQSRGVLIFVLRLEPHRTVLVSCDNVYLRRAISEQQIDSARRMIAITSQALASINQRVVQQRLQAWQVLSGRNAHIIGSKLYILQAASFVLKDFAKSIDSANYSEALSLVEHCVVGISRVVNELRRFGRRRPPEWRSLDMVALINQVVGRFRTVSSGVDVVWTPRAKSLTMRGDTLQLEEALAELLDNARHHLAPAGRIRVDLWHGHTDRGGLVRITVENPGPGVPERNKKLIFEPFYTTRSEGSGLGLAIVRQAVESHRGKIWECGVEGKSARFEIELPEEPGEEAVE